MTSVLLAAVAFLAMEPVVYAYHRWIMHGVGIELHRSHHEAHEDGGWEANDVYPLLSATVTVLGFGLGFNVSGLAPLVPVCVGVTVYGACYAFVHDVYIHRRLRWFTAEWRPLEGLKAAHRVHHIWHGEPYGMLFPVVPRALRERAARVDYDPFPGRSRGSAPSQVPADA